MSDREPRSTTPDRDRDRSPVTPRTLRVRVGSQAPSATRDRGRRQEDRDLYSRSPSRSTHITQPLPSAGMSFRESDPPSRTFIELTVRNETKELLEVAFDQFVTMNFDPIMTQITTSLENITTRLGAVEHEMT